ncbi:hypothetical protein Tco_1042328 [Tanacetum coccineum]|uniref:Uncharacterized protein n=1 Tax=Tanacetum coccineum TaxID=301880 RepID=A0ABQ5GJF3_9ASTR
MSHVCQSPRSYISITTTLPEITPFIALQLRVAKLEQDMSEVKKTDHSAAALASIKSQVPTVVDKYLGTKLDDALLRILERHTADLIEKYFVLPGPESIKNQESKKSPKEIIRIKREQGEKKQESTYTIRSTDKVALEEFDLKSALFKHMQKNRTANRNPANYHLYHALVTPPNGAWTEYVSEGVTSSYFEHKAKGTTTNGRFENHNSLHYLKIDKFYKIQKKLNICGSWRWFRLTAGGGSGGGEVKDGGMAVGGDGENYGEGRFVVLLQRRGCGGGGYYGDGSRVCYEWRRWRR